MPKLSGFESLKKQLKQMAVKAADANVVVVVGFSQRYSMPVHERLDVFHPVGQAKYLEQPARELGPELGRIVGDGYKSTGNMKTSLLVAGLRLQREAQLLVPVDTSALKASAYTAEESEASGAATAAYNRSEVIRRQGGGR